MLADGARPTEPLISAAITQWEGQISLYDPRRGAPCYQCVFPEAPADGLAPSCAEAGVIGALPGVMGAMMAMEGIYTLREFGAESRVVAGIAISVVREFGVLIAGIVVAARSGSAIAARIGTMQIAQEIDALRVMGISPVRYLVAPILVAMLIMMPLLTVLSNSLAILGGGAISVMELHISPDAYLGRALAAVGIQDLVQGLSKSLVFGVLVTLVATSNGFNAAGGAEGLGRATTRSVVLSISAIVVADMIFTFFLSR